MNFTKMHGIGNDFVMVDGFAETLLPSALPETSRRVCHRKFGIGADGLILVLPSQTADFRMQMFNPDGSEAEMCGNGIRCFGKLVYDRGMTRLREIRVETGAGIKSLRLSVRDDLVDAVRVDMGEPALPRGRIPMIGPPEEPALRVPIEAGGAPYEVTAVSMGNPHVVLFTEDAAGAPVEQVGPMIENHPLFPQRTNVHFVQVCGPEEIVVRTWERGAGITLACGTGACASVVASVLNGRTDRKVLAHLPGGDLEIEWAGDNRVYMTGPAAEVFTGEVPL